MQDSEQKIPNILFLEDSATDAELVVYELRRAGIVFKLQLVSNEKDFIYHLESSPPDIILSDYLLPQFSGLEALRLLRRRGIEIPFILVTGSQTEEVAVECMKEGAVDYILKTNLMRLPSAVLNALRRSEADKQRADAVLALRKSEEQLLQAQKLEAVGRLAGGISHDFNNLLTAIIGYSELTLRQLQETHPLRRNIEEIKRASERAAALTRQLLAFSRKQVMQLKVFDLNEVVTELERMLRRMIGEDVELRTNLQPRLGNVKADPGQVEQVIMNLVVNARDAMPAGGKLTIETSSVYLDESYVQQHIAVTPGLYIMLAVSDTGLGISEEIRPHIFEPFFTTKEAGKGTGLGLSTVYGIIKQSGGSVWVYSEPGNGTTFKIYFPCVIDEAEDYKHGVPSAVEAGGSETILLVEDDDMVRNLAREVLSGKGYRVLEASNGSDAKTVCEQFQKPIDLLLADVVMPGVSGSELAERLVEIRPEMQVLFMSGYTEDAIINHGVLGSGVNFIQKPFNPDSLAHKVREVLDVATPRIQKH